MSLHYLVKLEMLIARVLQLHCWIEKLQNLSHLNCGLQIRPVVNSVWKLLQEGVQNMHHCSGAINDATDEWLPQ